MTRGHRVIVSSYFSARAYHVTSSRGVTLGTIKTERYVEQMFPYNRSKMNPSNERAFEISNSAKLHVSEMADN